MSDEQQYLEQVDVGTRVLRWQQEILCSPRIDMVSPLRYVLEHESFMPKRLRQGCKYLFRWQVYAPIIQGKMQVVKFECICTQQTWERLLRFLTNKKHGLGIGVPNG